MDCSVGVQDPDQHRVSVTGTNGKTGPNLREICRGHLQWPRPQSVGHVCDHLRKRLEAQSQQLEKVGAD